MTNEDAMIACPQCDALYTARAPDLGEKAVCARCHTVLIAPRRNALLRVMALAVTVVILMAGATFFPFLSVNVAGLSNASSVFDAALAFMDGGAMMLLSVLVLGLIVLIPVLRAVLVLYVLLPLSLGRKPLRHARGAFRLSEELRPWSMAEIFVIGVAVALVKVSDLAQVGYGPAFWMFAALVLISVFQDGMMDRWTIWKTLDEADR
ncbi:paraquat-inducible protein A [Profundibacterium mesophilum]|uniref:Paraquat-inducible protein n=1 Tax=Profundibacterium mesophilum KAUST100406-0324 TaxID=1037889 RepID=A0A921NTR2_9RHOB|nr:paraquat-inducible protein A [Profundibacterium mesophilum]KAF0675370.1 putative paraquat-inducible protein [Profundibacterium mesophilum KAUST100406-0324]